MAEREDRLLLFGASGAIGGAILDAAVAHGWQVTAVSRHGAAGTETRKGVRWIEVDPLATGFSADSLATERPYTSVCWAQGANLNDSVYDVSLESHLAIYNANCTYILITLQALLKAGLLERGSRMCVISSIWQNLARQNKLSYRMTKAALQGLVLSASADLAVDGHLMNAVLPGALDTPMTRRNLDTAQLNTLTSATRFQRLPALGDVTSLVLFLCSTENTGITGQFIAADLGFSNVRLL